MAKIHVFTGNERSGKSTWASMAAIRSAMHQNKTLLLSLDSKKPLESIFQLNIGSKKKSLSRNLILSHFSCKKTHNHKEAISLPKKIQIDTLFSKKGRIQDVPELFAFSPESETLTILSLFNEAICMNEYDDIYIDFPSLLTYAKVRSLSFMLIKHLQAIIQQKSILLNTLRKEQTSHQPLLKIEEMNLLLIKNLLIQYESLNSKLMDSHYVEMNLVTTKKILNQQSLYFIKNIQSNTEIKIHNVCINRCSPDAIETSMIANLFPESTVEVLNTYSRPIVGMERLSKFCQQFYNYFRTETETMKPAIS